jgi:dienelactone hydrolase
VSALEARGPEEHEMKMRILAILLALVVAGQTRAQPREQVLRIPTAGDVSMLATVMRPAGTGKRPLAIINHGSPVNIAREDMGLPRYDPLSSWFVARGYVVVLPLRRGYGGTGGDWAENYGQCQQPDYYNAGLHGAQDIRAALAFMRRQPYVAADRSIVIGESAGGWATLALSSQSPPGVSGMINFAGGRGGRQRLADSRIGNCTPDALVTAAGRYGATARVPTLWIYTANDSFFNPVLTRRMFDAYAAAGGHGTYRLLPAFGMDGHALVNSGDGVATWSGPVSEFLANLQ